MPKKVTHWLVSQQTAAGLRGSPPGGCVAERPGCMLVGALLQDAPFYARKLHCNAALFYLPRFLDRVPGLPGCTNFPDPETGIPVLTTARDLYSRAIESSIDSCRDLEPDPLNTTPLSPRRLRMRFDRPAHNRADITAGAPP